MPGRARSMLATLLAIVATALLSCGGAQGPASRAVASAAPEPVSVAAVSGASQPRTRAGFLAAAEAGVAASRAQWWDPSRGWYRQSLRGGGLASNWGIVHLFGAVDAVAIAN